MKRLQELFWIAGRTALVTGSSRGIGKAIALALAGCGADVIVHCAQRREEAEGTAAEIEALGVKTSVVVADLSADDAADSIANACVARHGKVDIFVSNASIQLRTPWLEISRAEFDRQITINLRSAFELMQKLTPGMIERRWGRILTIGSVQQITPAPQLPIYAATKSAQMNLVVNLAAQLGPHGITVNNISPGLIETDRNAAIRDSPERLATLMERVKVGVMGQPEDCVGAALVLCSDAGRYVTGADWLVDGGWSLH